MKASEPDRVIVKQKLTFYQITQLIHSKSMVFFSVQVQV